MFEIYIYVDLFASKKYCRVIKSMINQVVKMFCTCPQNIMFVLRLKVQGILQLSRLAYTPGWKEFKVTLRTPLEWILDYCTHPGWSRKVWLKITTLVSIPLIPSLLKKEGRRMNSKNRDFKSYLSGSSTAIRNEFNVTVHNPLE